MEQAPQGTEPARVQQPFRQHSLTHGLIYGWSLGTRELDSIILVGPLQLLIFYDSIVLYLFTRKITGGNFFLFLTYHGNESSNKTEVFQMIWVNIGGWVYL